MMYRFWLFKRVWAVLLWAALAMPGAAQERAFALAVPGTLMETGFPKYVVPRFSLKAGTRITLVGAGDTAEAALANGPPGIPVFEGLGALWHLRTDVPDHPGVSRFIDWIGSEIGLRTVTTFEIDGAAVFGPPKRQVAAVAEVKMTGDAERGAALSRQHCARCHVVRDDDRMNAIGSTPSFFVLRTLRDWDARFQAFYALNPHPAFTQVEEVTPPFPPNLPSPIVPLEITVEDLEAILAYVSALPPADLGAPLQLQ